LKDGEFGSTGIATFRRFDALFLLEKLGTTLRVDSCLVGDFAASNKTCVDDDEDEDEDVVVVGCFERGGDCDILVDCNFTDDPPATDCSELLFGEEVVVFETVIGDELSLTGSLAVLG
jgi:hypothetical protein